MEVCVWVEQGKIWISDPFARTKHECGSSDKLSTLFEHILMDEANRDEPCYFHHQDRKGELGC